MGFLMVDFQEHDHIIIKHKSLFIKIKNLLIQQYPFESGGLVDKDLNILYYPSVDNDCHSYTPPPQFFVDLVKKSILFSFHSHLHILNPSDEDIFFLKSYDVPIIIYSLNNKSFLSVNTNNEASRFTWSTQKISLSDF